MSHSVSLVLARQLASEVLSLVDVDESPAVGRLVRRGKSAEDARNVILARTARSALALTRGDERVAKRALVIVNAQGNRLPQCVELLKHFDAELVKAAYRLHDELVSSTCSITQMCRIIEALGYVPAEDDDQLAFVLDEIACACVSQKQQFFWLKKMPALIKEFHELDVVLDYVMGDLRHRLWEPFESGIDDEEFQDLWEALYSYDWGEER